MRFLISLLMFVSSASAEVGLSAFALMHEKYPCTKFLQAYDNVAYKAVSILDGTFGSDTTCLHRFLKLAGKRVVQIHIRYIPKNKPEIFDKALLSRRAKKWEGYRLRYPEVEWLLSDGLESHDYKGSAKRRVGYIKRFFKGKIVHNPLVERDPYIVGADVIELHDIRYIEQWRRETIFSYDGFGVDYRDEGRGRVPFCTSVSSVRSDLRKAKRDGNLVFLWDAWGQGTARTGVGSDPRKRTFEIVGNTIKNELLRKYN